MFYLDSKDFNFERKFMKKLLLSTTATLLLASFGTANAAPQNSYLHSADTSVVTSGTGLCWNTSGDKMYSSACGDTEPAAPAKVAPAKVTTPAPVVAVEKKAVEVNIDLSILFGFDSSSLSKKAQDDLTKFAHSYNLKSVSLVGHADRFGKTGYNNTLSQKRADAVKKFLVSVGVNPEIIKPVTSVGQSDPAVQCSKKTIPCEAPNRRVTVQATGVEK